ncbi:MAG: DNA polymerase III subunit delta, partial [Pseudomonadota bacterium]
AFLVAQLGADAAITRSELDKLDLYMGERRDVRLEDVAACIGDSSALELDQLLHATTTGDTAGAMRLTERLLDMRHAPVAIVRQLQGHWQRLWRLRIEVEAGASPASVVDGARPPIFFKAKPKAIQALGRLSAADLRGGLMALLEAERRLKTTGYPGPLVLRHTILALTTARR